MKITKSKIQVYYLRNIGDISWADISIDEGEKSGRISISSDWGNWANYWGACGESFKKFLCSLNMEYFAGKVGEDRWLDIPKSIQNWKRELLDYRRMDSVDEKEARLIWNELKELEECADFEFMHELYQKEEFMKFQRYSPDTCTSVSPRFRNFWNNAWMPFCEHLKQEIAEVDAVECPVTPQ